SRRTSSASGESGSTASRRASCTRIQSSTIACRWSQKASRCQFHSSGVAGSFTCHAARTKRENDRRSSSARARRPTPVLPCRWMAALPILGLQRGQGLELRVGEAGHVGLVRRRRRVLRSLLGELGEQLDDSRLLADRLERGLVVTGLLSGRSKSRGL